MENNINQNQQPNQPQAMPTQTSPPVPNPQPSSGMSNVGPNLSIIFNKFYSNKKVFWPVAIFLGLMFFIVILGLLFGQKQPVKVIAPRPTQSPFSLSTPIASPSSEFLGGEYQKLLNLKNRLEVMDVKQRDLSPPSLNFDVKF